MKKEGDSRTLRRRYRVASRETEDHTSISKGTSICASCLTASHSAESVKPVCMFRVRLAGFNILSGDELRVATGPPFRNDDEEEEEDNFDSDDILRTTDSIHDHYIDTQDQLEKRRSSRDEKRRESKIMDENMNKFDVLLQGIVGDLAAEKKFYGGTFGGLDNQTLSNSGVKARRRVTMGSLNIGGGDGEGGDGEGDGMKWTGLHTATGANKTKFWDENAFESSPSSEKTKTSSSSLSQGNTYQRASSASSTLSSSHINEGEPQEEEDRDGINASVMSLDSHFASTTNTPSRPSPLTRSTTVHSSSSSYQNHTVNGSGSSSSSGGGGGGGLSPLNERGAVTSPGGLNEEQSGANGGQRLKRRHSLHDYRTTSLFQLLSEGNDQSSDEEEDDDEETSEF
mmetsp:Transcript_18244/g.21574  ORF Transcript_18244/g.21574 Transcript_18244/m.21574 type:complete len:398 (-) Transcript_18244:1512-2705(-)